MSGSGAPRANMANGLKGHFYKQMELKLAIQRRSTRKAQRGRRRRSEVILIKQIGPKRSGPLMSTAHPRPQCFVNTASAAAADSGSSMKRAMLAAASAG